MSMITGVSTQGFHWMGELQALGTNSGPCVCGLCERPQVAEGRGYLPYLEKGRLRFL